MKNANLRRHVLHIALAAGLLASPLTSQESGEIDLERLAIPYEKFVLDNGLTVIVHEDHSVPIVAVNLWYHVGSRNEERGRTGFAHLFEHFFFNGSENYPHGFREAMDDLGVNNRNGTTSFDRTNFFEDVPISGLERTLYLEADRMGWLAGNLSREMLERERGVVQNEKRQGENRPYGRVFELIPPAIYPHAHPYSWNVIGTMEDLDAATLEDVKKWYETHYGPNNCVLSLAGDITTERAREVVERYFGPIPPGPPIAKLEEWVPRFERDVRETMQDRVPQTRIYRVYHAPPWGSRELQHLKLAAQVLSGSKSSRLDRRLIYEKELATDVWAFVWDKELASNLFLIVTAKPGVEPAVLEAEMDAVVEELLSEGPSEDELALARSRLQADFLRGIERLGGFGGRSDVLAESMTYGDDPHAYLKQFRGLARAGTAEVLQTSKRWLGAHHYTMTVVPFPELAAAEESIDRSQLPELGEAGEVRFPEVQRRRLANGLEVLLLERHSVPLVEATLRVDSGYASDPAGKEGLASLAADLMDEGTAQRDGFALADALDRLGANLSTGSSLDHVRLELDALAPNLGPSLELLAEVAQVPAFPQEMVRIAKQRRLARIDQEMAEPVAAALRTLPPLLYGTGHAYAVPFTGSGYRETVEPLGRDELVAWHRTWFRPESSALIVAGDVTLEELLPQVDAAFGGWSAGEAPGKQIDRVETASTGTVFLLDRPDAEQSVIVAGHVSQPGGLPQDLSMETVMRLFGGMSTSRLNRNLRLDKHWSYGTWGFLSDATGQRPFMVVAPVQTDQTAPAMREVLGEIRGIAGERPIAGEEFSSIRRNMILRLPGRFETLESLESAAIDLVHLGYPPEYFYNYADNVRTLSEEDLNAAAAQFIRPQELAWLVIGDLAEIEAPIRELDFGDVVILDSDGRLLGETQRQ